MCVFNLMPIGEGNAHPLGKVEVGCRSGWAVTSSAVSEITQHKLPFSLLDYPDLFGGYSAITSFTHSHIYQVSSKKTKCHTGITLVVLGRVSK